jgi:hypothetical protein
MKLPPRARYCKQELALKTTQINDQGCAPSNAMRGEMLLKSDHRSKGILDSV